MSIKNHFPGIIQVVLWFIGLSFLNLVVFVATLIILEPYWWHIVPEWIIAWIVAIPDLFDVIPIPRFVITFLLNLALTYTIVRRLNFSRGISTFLIITPPIFCVLFFVLLGIMQQSHRGFDLFLP